MNIDAKRLRSPKLRYGIESKLEAEAAFVRASNARPQDAERFFRRHIAPHFNTLLEEVERLRDENRDLYRQKEVEVGRANWAEKRADAAEAKLAMVRAVEPVTLYRNRGGSDPRGGGELDHVLAIPWDEFSEALDGKRVPELESD